MLGACSGFFALFTMYLPPLFPTLLRTTGAGFCYNIGRIAAAVGTVVFGLLSPVGDKRLALLYSGCLFLPAALIALAMPSDEFQAEPTEKPTRRRRIRRRSGDSRGGLSRTRLQRMKIQLRGFHHALQ